LQINKIAIIGASGFLGSYLFSALSKNFKVIGTYYSRPSKDLYHLEVRDEKQVRQFFEKFHPDLVVVAGGMTRPDECELNKELAHDVNVKGIKSILKYCGCKLIYFSTDYVFDGEKGFYSEEETPNPINYYGRTKLWAEEIVLDNRDNNVVIRVAGLYGYNERNNEFLNSLNSSPLYKAMDLFSSTLLINGVEKYLPFFIKERGIYHLTSGSALSRYDFTSIAVRILGVPIKVIGKQAKEIYHIAKRPQNSSLISVRHKLKVCKEREGLHIVKNA